MALIKVLKWGISATPDVFEIPGIRVVLFGSQHGKLYVWTECYGGISKEDHIKLNLFIYPTGIEFRDNTRAHIMSCQDGVYVWHLYQEVGRNTKVENS